MACGIYKITNQINGKVYIGQSRRIEERWQQHKRESFKENSSEYYYPLYIAFREDGIESFTFEILEECLSEELNQKEIEYISLYESYPPEKGKGYNQTPGGEFDIGGKLLEYQEEIKKDLVENSLSIKEIAFKFQVSIYAIYTINWGKSYYDPNLKYPLKIKQKKKCFCSLCGKEIASYSANYCNDCRKIVASNNRKKSKFKVKMNDFKYCSQCGKKLDPSNKSGLCKKCYMEHIKKNPQIRNYRDKISLPLKEDLLKDLYEMKKDYLVAEKYGISTMLLKDWKIELEIPRKRSLVDRLYEEEYLHIPPKEEKPKLPYKKAVLQISLETGEILNEFESCNAAERFLGVKNGGGVNSCCLGKIKKSYGYFWKYKE